MRRDDPDIIEMFEVSPGRFIPLQEALEQHESAHEAARLFNIAADMAMNKVLYHWLTTGKSKILKEFCKANGVPLVEIKLQEE